MKAVRLKGEKPDYIKHLVFLLILLVSVGAVLITDRQAFGEGTAFNTLQQMIDQAQSGERIEIPAGVYEGPIMISKPVKLVAEEEGTAQLIQNGVDPAITVEADDVTVSGLQIVDRTVKDSAAISVIGDRVELTRLHILTGSHGIQIRNANEGKLLENRIEWQAESEEEIRLTSRKNGIDLLRAHSHEIRGNTIKEMLDGIYAESSNDNIIRNNKVEKSRYGYHLMYADGGIVEDNEGFENFTGAMIMMVNNAEISGNHFARQQENVNAQGISLFEVTDSVLRHNELDGNRVGMYVEKSNQNLIAHNQFTHNFVGVLWEQSENNTLDGNVFSGNVTEVLAQDGLNNEIQGNYWDTFQGIDRDGDGISDYPYISQPFFMNVLSRQPAFQLFFHSPGILLLETMLGRDSDYGLTDTAPLMQPPEKREVADVAETSRISSGIVGVLLILSASILWIWTRRKTK